MTGALGDAELARIARAESATLYRFVVCRLPGEAETARDIVQDCFLALLRSGPGLRGEASVATWLRAVAKRKVVDHYRRRSREGELGPEGEGGIEASPAYHPEERLLEGGERELVWRCLAALSPEKRYSLVLKYVDGLSQAEIARILGKTVKASESVLGRARAEFARLYAREEGR